MGINKLLPFLKPLSKNVHIRRYSTSVAAIDAMCWIHRAMVASASKHLIGEDSIAYLKFILSMLSLLFLHDVTPIMVFDGLELPAKEAENAKRRERRNQARDEALRMYKSGKYDKGEFYRKCIQAITVTDDIIDKVIATCKHLKIQVIIAPFEADPQVSYLCRTGIASLAISEDSDLLVYGCPRVLYKLTKEGNAEEMNIVSICHLPSSISSKYPKGANPSGSISKLKEFTPEMFATMCILSGSDYDDDTHIHGMGIVMAYNFVAQYRDIRSILEFLSKNPNWKNKLPKHLSLDELIDKYRKSLCIFMHYWVYDPESETICNISKSRDVEVSFTDEEIENLGSKDKVVDAVQVATGIFNAKSQSQRNLELTDEEKELIESSLNETNAIKVPTKKSLKTLLKNVETHNIKKRRVS